MYDGLSPTSILRALSVGKIGNFFQQWKFTPRRAQFFAFPCPDALEQLGPNTTLLAHISYLNSSEALTELPSSPFGELRSEREILVYKDRIYMSFLILGVY